MQLVYTTSRLILKTLDPSYADRVCKFYADNRNFFEPWEPKRVDNFYTPEFHKISLKYEEIAIANYHMLRLWIFNKYDPSTIIGCISFSDMKKGALLNCQLSYKIDQNHTRQGFATEALNYAIPLMFEGYQFHKIDALVHPKNTTSIHLLENLNFELEGTSKAYINLNDKWVDHLRYSLVSYK